MLPKKVFTYQKDFKSVDPVKSAMAQFHEKESWPTLMFQLNDG